MNIIECSLVSLAAKQTNIDKQASSVAPYISALKASKKKPYEFHKIMFNHHGLEKDRQFGKYANVEDNNEAQKHYELMEAHEAAEKYHKAMMELHKPKEK